MSRQEDEVRNFMADPLWGVVTGPHNAIHIHPPTQCEGQKCPWHNPSDHHMNQWNRVIRLDRNAMTERVCPHGVGHPDPDSLAWMKRVGIDDDGTHGCDGCCRRSDD